MAFLKFRAQSSQRGAPGAMQKRALNKPDHLITLANGLHREREAGRRLIEILKKPRFFWALFL